MTTDTLVIIAIILSGITLLGLIVLAILLVKLSKKNAPIDNSKENLMITGELKAKLEQINKDIPNYIDAAIKDSTIKSLGEIGKANELNNEKLERFQKSITESIELKFKNLNDQLNVQLVQINKRVDDRLEGGFKDTNETFKSFIERLAKIDAAQKNIEELSGEVVSLKDILENNQQRGQYGEFQLSMILNNVFGSSVGLYQEQYTLKGGPTEDQTVRADAVVFLPPPYKMICIDSKFPFQDYKDIINCKEKDAVYEEKKKNFRAAIKKHITDIKNKYIVPNKTAPQAFMFIPSDGIFAFLHVEMHDLVEESQKANVIMASPAILQAMLATMGMLNINYKRSQNLDQITKQLQGLSKDFDKWNADWAKLSKNLSTVSNVQAELDKRVGLMTTKFDKIKNVQLVDSETGEEVPAIESDKDDETN